MNFGSDNQTGASRQVLEMLTVANDGITHGYGDDEWTQQAVDALKDVFECDLDAYFVPTGTAANCLALSCMVQPWETILCHSHAHINVDESTAPEQFTGGARMLPISKGAGKITVEHLDNYFANVGTHEPHNPLARALSITQASEAGLVYFIDEVKSLCAAAKEHGLSVHMDGARFANALVTQNCSPAELTWKAGVDVLCLGATKCGALCAEAVIFFNKDLAKTFIHRRKRAGHLVSKGRLFGAQFLGWLKDNHWLELATHANSQAAKLAGQLATFEGVQLVWPVQANEVFVTMPKGLVTVLWDASAEFYDWYPDVRPADMMLGEDEMIVRLVTSFSSRDEERVEFCERIEDYFKKNQAC
jgi:threonine aldolase